MAGAAGDSPGFLWFGAALVSPHTVASWSFLNGMETAVNLLFFALALATFPARLTTSGGLNAPGRYGRWLLSMFFFGLMVLSRLDDVFFLLPLFLLVWACSSETALRKLLAFAAPVLMLLGYVSYNRATVGVFLPSSGVAKAGLALHGNLYAASRMVLPNYWDAPGHTTGIGFALFPATFEKVLQMLLPAMVCAAFLLWRRPRRTLLGALCVGVLLKSAYNLFFVDLFHQGSWYYGVSVSVANLCIACAISALLEKANLGRNARHTSRHGVLPVLGALVLIAICANIFLDTRLRDGRALTYMAIVNHRDHLREVIEQAGDDRFVEFNDGLVSYATDMPALSGFGLALDPEGNRARRDGHFLQLAVSRGYHLAVALGTYQTTIESMLPRLGRDRSASIFDLRPSEFETYTLQPVTVDPVTQVAIYRIVPRR